MSYQSEITHFFNELKEQNPNLETEQQAGRALLWDKNQMDIHELESRKQLKQAIIPQKPYVYGQ